MAITIIQKPLYTLIPAGQEHIIFSVYDAAVITANPAKHKIKYIADVYVGEQSTMLTASSNLVAKLKVTPNDMGYGMFDLSPIVANYLSAEYEGGQVSASGGGSFSFSEFKGVPYSDMAPHPIHLIDKFSGSRNSVRYVTVRFHIEYAETATGEIDNIIQNLPAPDMIFFNGVLYDTDMYVNSINVGWFGYDITQDQLFPRNSICSLLTSAPTTQYIRENDYATIPFFTELDNAETGIYQGVAPLGAVQAVRAVRIEYFDIDAGSLGVTTHNLQLADGGHYGYIEDAFVKIQYWGVGTQNQTNAGNPPPANWSYYAVWLLDDQDNIITEKYTYYKQEESCKGYETVRLTWLNKWGTWDYYNFTQKNIRNIKTTRKAYKQLSGTWNKPYFQLSGHVGGMKNYNSTIKESITLNTDYITEEEALWLEQLFISNDVYMLTDSPLSDVQTGTIRRYVQPVRITSEDMTRKTKANDKLIQYTFELETNRTKKSHKI